MFTHWSPMRSMCLIMCSSAATRRRSPATGRLQGEQREDPLVDLQVAPVDAVVVGDHHLGELDVLVVERLEHAVELLDDRCRARRGRAASSSLQLCLEVRRGRGVRRRLRGAGCGRAEAPRGSSSLAELAGDIFLGPRVARVW